MLIEKILDSKGRSTAAVRPTATVANVACMLSERRVGAVVVEDLKGSIIGIFCKRDLVKLVASRGADALVTRVKEVMSSPVITCTPTDRVDTVISTMNKRHIRHMPVTLNGALVGMVSMRDLTRQRLDEKEQETAMLLDLARLHA